MRWSCALGTDSQIFIEIIRMNQEKSITPRQLVQGNVQVPGSKSYAQRAIALAALSKSGVTLNQITACDDVVAAFNVIERLGASVQQQDGLVHVKSNFNLEKKYTINCGEAGLSTRLFSAFSLLTDQSFTVKGTGSILNRPMDMVVDALQQMGKHVNCNNGKLPLVIAGATKPNSLKIDGSTSSQLLTGLLIVAPFLPFDLTINVKDLKSIPYVEMTMKIMREFSLEVEHHNFNTFYVKGNQSIQRLAVYDVEGDWSGAAFLIVAALIGGELKLSGLQRNTIQADRAILDVVTKANGYYAWKEGELHVRRGNLQPFHFDATHCPDLFPPLVALAAMIEGQSSIAGVHRLAHKESDRAQALIDEFAKLGVVLKRDGDELIINGLQKGAAIAGGTVHSHHDHRMAMALSLLALRSESAIFIEAPDAIRKSYPLFYQDFEAITA